MSRETKASRDVEIFARKVGLLVADCMRKGGDDEQRGTLSESEKALIIAIAQHTDISPDAQWASLEASIGALMAAGITRTGAVKYARATVAHRVLSLNTDRELDKLAAQPSLEKLVDFIEQRTSSRDDYGRPQLGAVLFSIRAHFSSFQCASDAQKSRIQELMRTAFPQFGPQGVENQYWKGDEVEARYLEQTIALFSKLAEIVQRARLVSSACGGRFDRLPLGELPLRIVAALSLNGTDQEMARRVLRQPMSAVEPVLNAFNRIHEIRGTGEPITSALASTVNVMHDAGLSCLIMIYKDVDGAGKILRRLFAARVDDAAEDMCRSIERAIDQTLIQSFSRNDEAAVQWQRAWREDFHEEAVARLRTPDIANHFATHVVKNRLSAYASMMFSEAEALHEAARTAFHNGDQHDGGLVCLAYMRVLEIELNLAVARALAHGDPCEYSQTNSFDINLREAVMKLCREGDACLSMGQLRSVLGKLRRSTKISVGASSILAKVFSKSGLAAISDGSMAKCISDDVCRRYRNPPAHTSFLDWASVDECRSHVFGALMQMNGKADLTGQTEGWLKAH